MSVKRVAVVTGSNKGIGLSIVKGLCKSFDGIVYLTGKINFLLNIQFTFLK
jgi:carbonyl reductase 1